MSEQRKSETTRECPWPKQYYDRGECCGEWPCAHGSTSETTPRVLVCGGREYADWRTMSDILWGIHHDTPIAEIIHGGARGADEMATRWATLANVPLSVIKADWQRHGKAAGPLRNQEMLDRLRPTLVVAFPGGRGTADMVRRAKAAGVEVVNV